MNLGPVVGRRMRRACVLVFGMTSSTRQQGSPMSPATEAAEAWPGTLLHRNARKKGGVEHVQRRAFTLLELMVVLAIMVAVLAVAWPRMRGRLNLVAPREAAMQLKTDLVQARQQSVLTGEPWLVRIERGTRNYELGPLSAFVDRNELSSMVNGATGGADSDEDLSFLYQQPSNQPQSASDLTSASSIGQSNASNAGGSFANSNGFSKPPTPVVEKLELPDGMIFDDGFAHQVQDTNAAPDSLQSTAQQIPPTPAQPSMNGIGQPSIIGAVPFVTQTADPNAMQQGQLAGQLPGQQPAQSASQIGLQSNWKYAVIYQPDGRATESEIRLKALQTESTIRLRVRGFTGATTIDGVERKPAVVPLLDSQGYPIQGDPAQGELRNPKSATDFPSNATSGTAINNELSR